MVGIFMNKDWNHDLFLLLFFFFNPLISMSDQDSSLYNINTKSRRQVMRTKKIIS